MLDVGPVHVLAGKFQVGLDGLARVVGIADDESADDIHFVLVQVVNRAQGGIAGLASSLAKFVLGRGLQELEIVFENVFDAEKHITESRSPHQRRQRIAMHRDGRCHRLHGVDNVVQAGIDDGLAERLKALDVEADVVVDDEDGAGAVIAGVANVGQDAIECVGVKVAAAHLDDGAEAAIEGAAARGLDHINWPAHHGVVVQHPRVALG